MLFVLQERTCSKKCRAALKGRMMFSLLGRSLALDMVLPPELHGCFKSQPIGAFRFRRHTGPLISCAIRTVTGWKKTTMFLFLVQFWEFCHGASVFSFGVEGSFCHVILSMQKLQTWLFWVLSQPFTIFVVPPCNFPILGDVEAFVLVISRLCTRSQGWPIEGGVHSHAKFVAMKGWTKVQAACRANKNTLSTHLLEAVSRLLGCNTDFLYGNCSMIMCAIVRIVSWSWCAFCSPTRGQATSKFSVTTTTCWDRDGFRGGTSLRDLAAVLLQKTISKPAKVAEELCETQRLRSRLSFGKEKMQHWCGMVKGGSNTFRAGAAGLVFFSSISPLRGLRIMANKLPAV